MYKHWPRKGAACDTYRAELGDPPPRRARQWRSLSLDAGLCPHESERESRQSLGVSTCRLFETSYMRMRVKGYCSLLFSVVSVHSITLVLPRFCYNVSPPTLLPPSIHSLQYRGERGHRGVLLSSCPSYHRTLSIYVELQSEERLTWPEYLSESSSHIIAIGAAFERPLDSDGSAYGSAYQRMRETQRHSVE